MVIASLLTNTVIWAPISIAHWGLLRYNLANIMWLQISGVQQTPCQ